MSCFGIGVSDRRQTFAAGTVIIPRRGVDPASTWDSQCQLYHRHPRSAARSRPVPRRHFSLLAPVTGLRRAWLNLDSISCVFRSLVGHVVFERFWLTNQSPSAVRTASEITQAAATTVRRTALVSDGCSLFSIPATCGAPDLHFRDTASRPRIHMRPLRSRVLFQPGRRHAVVL